MTHSNSSALFFPLETKALLLQKTQKGGKEGRPARARGWAQDEEGGGTGWQTWDAPASPGDLKNAGAWGFRAHQAESIARTARRRPGRWGAGAASEGPSLRVGEGVHPFPVRGAPGSSWHLFTAFLLLFCQPVPSDTPILTLLTPPHFPRSCLHLRLPCSRARGRGESQETGSWMRPSVPLRQLPKRFRARPWVQEAMLQHQPHVPQSRTLSTRSPCHTPQAEGPGLPDASLLQLRSQGQVGPVLLTYQLSVRGSHAVRPPSLGLINFPEWLT